MAKKVKEDTLNLDNILFKCRDILRQAKNSGSFFEKRDMMLTLVFLRFIGEKYDDGVAVLRQRLIEEGLDPDDEEIRKAFFDDATFADGTFDLPVEARWSTIINTAAPQLNVALDTALRSIGETNPTLKGCFVEGTFTQRNLGANDMKKIVDEVNKISHKTFGEEKDLIGRVYEYFLKEFAVNATKEEGEFYTPHDVVQLIATVIEPYDGTLYDPCCGSGGMFIQSTDLVKAKQGDISRINVYGQEKEAATYRLAKMNLALRGISHNLGPKNQSTFEQDFHRGTKMDYIIANPPFNLKKWGIIRNIPFTILGGIICFLFFIRRMDKKPFRFLWICILFSFLFYIPVAVGAGAVPALGMLMLPKTVCYILVVCMFRSAVSDESKDCSTKR